jgi:hypothetical protein
MPPYGHVPWSVLLRERHWDPHIYCGPGGLVALAARPTATLDQFGAFCAEGWRPTKPQDSNLEKASPSENPPLIRQANLGVLRLDPGPEHWQPPPLMGVWCADPGDVVLNKMPPLRAAWVTAELPRHAVDPNCVLVKGLPRPTAFWLAVCLNQSPYQEYLLRASGAAAPRVRLGALRE